MRTIEEAALDYSDEHKHKVNGEGFILRGAFKAGIEFAQQFISVDDKLPDATKKDVEGVYYSENLLLKVKGYDHPFVGYYMKAEDDEFFEFIPEFITNEIMQEAITHWRLIELK